MRKAIFIAFLFVLGWALSADRSFAAVGVTLPNGNECLTVGQAYTITVSFSTDHVALYYRKDGAQPTHLDSSEIKHPLLTTTWSWTPSSADVSETGRIWAEGHSNNHNSSGEWDSSNANFAVRTSCAVGGGGESAVLGGSARIPFTETVRATEVTSESAVIEWTTYPASYTKLEYGTSTGVYTREFSLDAAYFRFNHTVTLSDLTPNTTYYFRTLSGRVVEEKLTSYEYSFTTLRPPDVIPPAPVSRVFGVAGASTTLLAWVNPPTDFKEAVIVSRNDRFAEHREDGKIVFRSTEPYYTDSGLLNGVPYYYSLFSLDFYRNTSPPVRLLLTPQAELGKAPTPPLTPEGTYAATTTLARIRALSSEPKDRSIVLRWRNPTEQQFLGVQIVRGTESLPANPYDGEIVFRGRAERYEDTGLAPEQRYSYGAFAFDWAGTFAPGAFIGERTEPVPEVIATLRSQIEEIRKIANELRLRVEARLGARKAPAPKAEPLVYNVSVTPEGFRPATITVPRGATVRWLNATDSFTWPASDKHPTHTIYPEFDAKRGIHSGEIYSFTFTKTGRWEYHDHLHAERTGVVVVR